MNEEQKIKQLPKDWKWVKLGEVCEKVETVKRKEKNPDDELLYLDIGGIDNLSNKILSHKNYKWKDAPSRAQQIVSQHDILFSTVRTYMKNIAVVNNKIYNGQVASSGFCVLRGNKEVINPKLIFYYTVSQSFLRPLNELQTGSSYPAVRDKDVFSQPFPLPPLPTQAAIVSKIEELFSALDKGIENLHIAQQQLKTYRQAVLKAAFEGRVTNEWRKQQIRLFNSKDFISEIIKSREIDYNGKLENWKKRKDNEGEEKIGKPQMPSNLDIKNDLFDGLVGNENIPTVWGIVPLVFISDNEPNSIVDGPFGSSINVAEDYIESGVPVIRMVNIRPFRFISDQMKFIKESKFQSLRRHNILPGDVLIAKVGATIGDCCLYPSNQPEAMLSTTGSCRVRLDRNVMDAKFLEYYISFHKNTLKEIASQTAQPFLNMKVLKSFPIVLPTIEEQQLIVAAIESRLSVADKMEESITQSLQQAEALRQSILKKAFEGRLVAG